MYRRKIPAAEWARVAQRRGRGGKVCLTSHSAVEKHLFGPRFFAQAKKGSSTAEWLVKVRSRAAGGRKLLILNAVAIAVGGEAKSKSFHSPSGSELLFFACAKKR